MCLRASAFPRYVCRHLAHVRSLRSRFFCFLAYTTNSSMLVTLLWAPFSAYHIKSELLEEDYAELEKSYVETLARHRMLARRINEEEEEEEEKEDEEECRVR